MPTSAWLSAVAVAAFALAAGCKNPSPVPFDVPVSPWSAGPNLPDPRLEPGVTALGEQLIVLGGFDTDVQAGLRVTTRVDVFDVPSQTWSQLADAPVARHHVQVATIATKLFLLGGLDGAADGSNDYPARGDSYSLDTSDPNATWQPIAVMPAGYERGSAGVVVVPPRIYLLGGCSTTDALASNIYYDSIMDAWCPGAACSSDAELPDLPSPRSHPAAAHRTDGTFFVAGGLLHLGSDTEEPDVFILAPGQQMATGTWTSGAPDPHPRGGCAYGVAEDRLLCAGGEAGTSALTYTEGYDLINDVWYEYPFMPMPRAGAQGAAIGDQLFVPGGAAELVFEPTDSLFVFSLNDAGGPDGSAGSGSDTGSGA